MFRYTGCGSTQQFSHYVSKVPQNRVASWVIKSDKMRPWHYRWKCYKNICAAQQFSIQNNKNLKNSSGHTEFLWNWKLKLLQPKCTFVRISTINSLCFTVSSQSPSLREKKKNLRKAWSSSPCTLRVKRLEWSWGESDKSRLTFSPANSWILT